MQSLCLSILPLNWDAVSRQIRDQVLSRQMLGQTCNNGINVNLLASPAASMDLSSGSDSCASVDLPCVQMQSAIWTPTRRAKVNERPGNANASVPTRAKRFC